MKIGAAYIRVSTEDQLEYSPDSQLKEIKKYAAAHDILLEYVFLDEGLSGRNAKKRPAFNEMIALAKSKEKPFEIILLWKFSRFARNQEESIVYKNMLRKEDGVEVVSVSEPIIDGPFGSLIERIIEWMDEYYSIRLSGEVTRGMTEKATRGEPQTAPPFGYNKPVGGAYVINEREAEYVRYVFDRYLSGESIFSIASSLNAIGTKTKRGNPFENRQVEYMINNPVYKGYVRWSPEGKTVSKRIYNDPNTIIKKSNHEPIIPEEKWDTANARYWEENQKRKRGSRPSDTKKHYLSGLLKCGTCGSTLSYGKANDGFQCIKYAHGICKPSHFIAASKIEAAVLGELDRLCEEGVFIENLRSLSDHSDERALYEKEIKGIEKMFDRAKSAYLAGIDTIEEYEANKTKLLQELNQKIEKLNTVPVDTIDQYVVKQKISSVRAYLKGDYPIAKKNAALSQIVEKIVFYRPEEYIEIFLYA